MSIAPLQKQFQNDQIVSAALSHVAKIADQALKEIRTTSYLLHPPLLDELGLASAVRWYTEGFSKRSGIAVNVSFPSDFARISNDSEIALFRVVQESLTNVHRHSGASCVGIKLECGVEAVTLEVKDNGHGISPQQVHSASKTAAEPGVGLAGMRERLNDLSGRMEIDSDARGTTLRFTVPLAIDRLLQPLRPEKTCPEPSAA